MTKSVDEQALERHRAKMAKRKEAQDAEVAEKTVEKGLLIVHTGTGKGKTTAAFGLALRMIGRGKRVGIVQFVKGAWHTAERDALERFGDQVAWYSMGEGFTWETQDKARDIAAARAGWEKAKEMILDERNTMVLLDEINIALRYEYLDLDEVLEFLVEQKPPMTHVVLTGRNAKEELIEIADLVTEMGQIKHPFRAGIKAQKGVEF